MVTYKGGKASVHKAKDVPENQWSLGALAAKRNNPNVDEAFLRVEHGTSSFVVAGVYCMMKVSFRHMFERVVEAGIAAGLLGGEGLRSMRA